MAFSFTSVAPNVLTREGGALLRLTGAWPLSTAIQAFVGPLGTVSDPACYSGVPGQGFTLYALNSAVLQCYAPVIPLGVASAALTLVVAGQTQTFAGAFTVGESLFYSQVYGLRSQLPINWAMGPRDFSHEKPL